VQVGLAPNPTAGYAASEVGNEGHSGQQGFYVGQEFVTGGKLRLNRNVTSQEVRRASQRLEGQKQRVLTDVRIGYYDVLVAQRRVELTKELQLTTTRGLEAVNAIVKAQEGSKSDVLQARVEAESALVLVQNAEAAHASAWLQLAAVVGNPGMPQSTVSGDLTSELPRVDFEEARARLLSASPEMGAASSEVNRARWSINQAKAQVIPNVDLQTTRQRDNSTGYWITGIQATVPVPILNRNQGGIRQAQAELVAAHRAADRVELSLDRRLALTYQQFISSRQRADRYANHILPNIRETLNLVNSSYKAGESSFLQLLTTQRTYVQANLTYLDAVRDTWAAYFEIEGLLLRGSLDQTSTTE
jgi:cobalt-zinc-cadmium efflux system outer membrane protein